MDFGIKCVKVCLYDWLLFVFYYLYRLYAIAFVFKYSNILRCIAVALSRQLCPLSSRKKQTTWRKLQGIADGHILLPRRRHQQDF